MPAQSQSVLDAAKKVYLERQQKLLQRQQEANRAKNVSLNPMSLFLVRLWLGEINHQNAQGRMGDLYSPASPAVRPPMQPALRETMRTTPYGPQIRTVPKKEY